MDAPPCRSVLVIDDNVALRSAYARILRGAGFEVAEATGENAFAVLDCARFGVVVSDIMMPGRDGFEISRYCIEKNPSARVILLSGSVHSPLLLKTGTLLGAVIGLAKPVAAEALIAAVTAALRSE